MKKWNRALFCTTAIGILGAGASALASPNATEPESATGVKEVVVTAQRRTEKLENVPMSVTVVTPAAISNAGITNFLNIDQIAVGVDSARSGGVPQIGIRGVTTTIAGYNTELNVAVYTDGFYDPQPVTLENDMANLQSVEVLKGPQGTLYGRNATGGAFLVTTRGPSKVLTGSFDASYGTYNERIVNGFIAGPITDRIRFSLSAHYHAGDSSTLKSSPTVIGATEGPAVRYEYYGVRAKLEADVTDKLLATIILNYGYQNDPRGNMYSVFDHVLPAPFLPLPPLRPTKVGTEAVPIPVPLYAYTYQAGLRLAYQTPIGTLTSFTGYSHRKFGDTTQFDGTYANIVDVFLNYLEDTWQESVDYQINAIKRVDLDVGAEYYNDDFKTAPQGFKIVQLGSFVDNSDQDQKTSAWAVYADATWHVTDRLSLNAGGRYSSDHRSMTFDTLGPGGIPYVPFVSDAHTFTAFTPRASVRYELAPRTDVYFSYSQGYRSGSYNGSGPPAAGLPLVPTKEENISAYEVGFKTANSFLRFESAIFYYDYTNLQVSLLVPNPLNPDLGNVSELQNAPKATVYGWDNELTVTPTEHLTLHANVEWLHGRYGSFTNANGAGVDPSNSVNITGETQNWTGHQMVRAPNYSGNVGLDYDQPITYGALLFSTNLSFTDSFPLSDPSLYGPFAPAALQNTQRFIQKSYVLLSAQLTWTDPSKRYSVTLYGNNLTNSNYLITYFGDAYGDVKVRADPITGGVKVGYKF